MGETERALDAVRQALARQSDNFPSLLHLASLRGRDGEIEEARQVADEVLRLVPSYRVAQTDKWLLTPRADFAEAFKEGLRRAGLPE